MPVNDQAAYDAGVAAGTADGRNGTSTPFPELYKYNSDYAAGYHEGMARGVAEHDRPVESEGIGPLGVILEGAVHGAEGIVKAVVAEGIVGGAESYLDASEENERVAHRAEGVLQRLDDTLEYVAGSIDGKADADQHRESMATGDHAGNPHYAAGYAASQSYAAGEQQAVDDGWNEQAEAPQGDSVDVNYEAGYQAGREAFAAGRHAGAQDSSHEQESAVPPQYQDDPAYSSGYVYGTLDSIVGHAEPEE